MLQQQQLSQWAPPPPAAQPATLLAQAHTQAHLQARGAFAGPERIS